MSDTASSLSPLDQIRAIVADIDNDTGARRRAYETLVRVDLLRALVAPQGDTSSPAPGLAWTREKPTAKGYYWRRIIYAETGKPCSVASLVGIVTIQMDNELSDQYYWEWAGPIPEPGAALAAHAQVPAAEVAPAAVATVLAAFSEWKNTYDQAGQKKVVDALWALEAEYGPGSASTGRDEAERERAEIAAGRCPRCGLNAEAIATRIKYLEEVERKFKAAPGATSTGEVSHG